MEILQQNWLLFSSHPWQILSLALLAFGMGWGAARLFYGERLEILKERANVPKQPLQEPLEAPATFDYPASGRHGRNLLSSTVREARVGDVFSLRAEVPKGSSLHIVLKGLPPIYLEDTSAAWSYSVVGVTNWVSGEYHQDMQSAEQHFDAEQGPAELKLYLQREGDLTIEVFEGGEHGAVWNKSLRVRPRTSANA